MFANTLDTLLRYIDRANVFLKWLSYLCLGFILLVMGYEIVLRYIFNSPTKFAFESATIAQVVLVSLGAGYVLREEGHVSISLVTERLPARQSNKLTGITSLIGFFMSAWLTYLLLDSALFSWKREEILETLSIPVYPFKFLLVLGLAFLSLQFLVRSRQYFNKGKN